MILSYFSFVFCFFIVKIQAECVNYALLSKNRCHLNEQDGQICFLCEINDSPAYYEGIVFDRNCVAEKNTQCIDLIFPSFENYLIFVEKYARQINDLFDPNNNNDGKQKNTLYINIQNDHTDQMNRSMILTLENVPHRTFPRFRLALRGRKTKKRLYIDPELKNVSFEYLELYIFCDIHIGFNVIRIYHHLLNTTIPGYIDCEQKIYAPVSTTVIPEKINPIVTSKPMKSDPIRTKRSSTTTMITVAGKKQKKTTTSKKKTKIEKISSNVTQVFLSTSSIVSTDLYTITTKSTTIITTTRAKKKKSQWIITITLSIFAGILPCLVIICCILCILCRQMRNDLEDLNHRRRDSLTSTMTDSQSQTETNSLNRRKVDEFDF